MKKPKTKVPTKKSNSIKPVVKSRLRWFDAEQDKPLAGQEIIFIDTVGMYRGTFHAIRSGVVYVDGKEEDTIEWEDIYQWIEYPNEC